VAPNLPDLKPWITVVGGAKL